MWSTIITFKVAAIHFGRVKLLNLATLYALRLRLGIQVMKSNLAVHFRARYGCMIHGCCACNVTEYYYGIDEKVLP